MTIREVQELNINHYGPIVEAKKLIEESAELLEAVVNFENGTGDIKNIIEELADVLFIAEQLKIYYEINSKELIDVQRFKADRQLERMEAEK